MSKTHEALFTSVAEQSYTEHGDNSGPFFELEYCGKTLFEDSELKDSFLKFSS